MKYLDNWREMETSTYDFWTKLFETGHSDMMTFKIDASSVSIKEL